MEAIYGSSIGTTLGLAGVIGTGLVLFFTKNSLGLDSKEPKPIIKEEKEMSEIKKEKPELNRLKVEQQGNRIILNRRKTHCRGRHLVRNRIGLCKEIYSEAGKPVQTNLYALSQACSS